MADYYDFSDDVILPDDFDAAAIDAAATEETASDVNSGETAPTTELTPGDGTEPQQETEEPTLAPEIPSAPQTIKVKYNHEERELGIDEATVYAQKGMNYDKLEARNKDLEATAEANNAFAKQLGYADAKEMMEAARKNFVNRQIRELVDEGNTEAMARFLVEQRMAKAAVPATAKESTSSPSEPKTEAPKTTFTPERRAELDEFIKAYPGITKLPEEVISANRNGVRLKAAYDNYQLKQKYAELQKERDILKQNQAAADKAPVTGVTGKAAPKKEEPIDPFMKGFDSAY